MAQQESDREDLMREATALVRRAELQVPGEPEPLVAGFRKTGHVAFYFGPDPVFQFDEQGRLRRAHVEGNLYRTQGRTLARLTRRRTAEQSELIRHDLTPPELAEFLATASGRLARVLEAFRRGEVRVLAQIPADAAMLSELESVLEHVLNRQLPLAPALPGKR